MNLISEQTQKIQKGDLYALLAGCSDEDLSPLVGLITSKWFNSLESHTEYKRFKPNHSKYHRIIGDELRRYGGNSFRNVFRGEGPPYAEIVKNVCLKLDIRPESDTVKNEGKVLSLFLERHWKTLNKAQQDAIIADARKSAADKSVTALDLFKAGGPFLALMVPRMFLGPIGWASLVWTVLGFNVADPSFKVTIPAVLHIAYLRRRFLDMLSEAAKASPTSAGSISRTSIPAVRSVSLTVGEKAEEPVLTLARISKPANQAWHPADPSGKGIGRLNPLLQAVPSLATAQNVAMTDYMEVVFNGPLMKAKGVDGYRCMTMIDGKPSHGTLLDPKELSNIVNASALFQVASVAVAQKHLADISAKLSDIKACIDRIHQFQKAGRRSILTGSIRYYEQVAPSVLAGELSEADASAVRHQIERHEADLLRVQDHLMDEIRHESQDVMNLKDDDMFGSAGMTEVIKKHQMLLDDLYQQLILCIRARGCGWQLLVAFPESDRLKEDRKASIQEALAILSEGNDMLSRTDVFMRQKIKSMSSVWNSTMTLNDRKLTLLEWNEKLLSDVNSLVNSIALDIRVAEAVLRERQEPVTMVVKIEDGRIVASSAA